MGAITEIKGRSSPMTPHPRASSDPSFPLQWLCISPIRANTRVVGGFGGCHFFGHAPNSMFISIGYIYSQDRRGSSDLFNSNSPNWKVQKFDLMGFKKLSIYRLDQHSLHKPQYPNPIWFQHLPKKRSSSANSWILLNLTNSWILDITNLFY